MRLRQRYLIQETKRSTQDEYYRKRDDDKDEIQERQPKKEKEPEDEQNESTNERD